MNTKYLLTAVAASTLAASAAAQIPLPSPLPPPVTIPPPLGYPGVFFDDFFSDNLGQPATTFDGFIQWDVSGGTVDFVGGDVLGAQGGRPFGRFVQLGGSSGDPGRFATRSDIVFLPGVTYTLSFAYLSSDATSHTATATLGDKTFTVSTSDPRQYSVFREDFTFDGLVPTSVPLAFQDLGDGQGGIGIDFVFVRPLGTPEAVPEPASLAALGLGALALLRKRRKV